MCKSFKYQSKRNFRLCTKNNSTSLNVCVIDNEWKSSFFSQIDDNYYAWWRETQFVLFKMVQYLLASIAHLLRLGLSKCVCLFVYLIFKKNGTIDALLVSWTTITFEEIEIHYVWRTNIIFGLMLNHDVCTFNAQFSLSVRIAKRLFPSFTTSWLRPVLLQNKNKQNMFLVIHIFNFWISK